MRHVRRGAFAQSNQYNVDPILDNNDWETISLIASQSKGRKYWNIGDAKYFKLNGYLGSAVNFNNITVGAKIIGFDHNSNLEGNHRIHFQIFYEGNTDNIAFADGRYGRSYLSSKQFCMNTGRRNTGGWASSQMRINMCGTSLVNYYGSFIYVIPPDLRSVLKSVIKYTDNFGNASTDESNVTSTIDYVFLPSETELFGNTSFGNPNESNFQQRYEYYQNNTKVKYSTLQQSNIIYWLRSPSASNSTNFTAVYESGNRASVAADFCYGFAPCFCV